MYQFMVIRFSRIFLSVKFEIFSLPKQVFIVVTLHADVGFFEMCRFSFVFQIFHTLTLLAGFRFSLFMQMFWFHFS